MQDRFDRIEDKIDSLHTKLDSYQERITRIETTQKGVIALCLAIITAALGTLAKALHL